MGPSRDMKGGEGEGRGGEQKEKKEFAMDGAVVSEQGSCHLAERYL